MPFKNFMNFAKASAAALAVSSAAITAPVQAQGDLLVAPTRVILDGSPGTEVILSNIGSEEATYRIGLELRRMMENGRLVPVERIDANSEEEAALGMICYAPRRITLCHRASPRRCVSLLAPERISRMASIGSTCPSKRSRNRAK